MTHFNASYECTKCELDLFYVPPTNTSIESSEYIEIEPLSKPDEHGPIEFTIEGNEKNYLDLNKTLFVPKRVNIRRKRCSYQGYFQYRASKQFCRFPFSTN